MLRRISLTAIAAFTLLCSIAYSESIGDKSMPIIEPSYKIVVLPTKYTVNSGEELEVFVTASGDGMPMRAKICVFSDLSVKLSDRERRFQECRITIPLDTQTYFKHEPDFQKLADKWFADKNLHNPAYRTVSEYADMIQQIHLKTSVPGDHIVYFTLAYTADDLKWQTDRLEFKFHVNTILDSHGWWLTTISVVIALLSLMFREGVPDFFRNIFTVISKICG